MSRPASRPMLTLRFLRLAVFLLVATAVHAQDDGTAWVREHYEKSEHLVPMRDGTRLFTAVYAPRDRSRSYPVLMTRTPYGVGPYGEDAYPEAVGPSRELAESGYVFVYQDVRGRLKSEGEFVAVRPHIPDPEAGEVDESTDTYDTVAWLLETVPSNGRVGVWGISADGFYATNALIDAHPAVKAVSPQAPVTDWFLGDDRRHNGAFQMQATFSFLSYYGTPRPAPTSQQASGFRAYGTPDGYDWYLDFGPLAAVNERFLGGENDLWEEVAVEHDTYDAYWQARTPLPHLRDVGPAALVVGGWFDAQDLYGPLKTYRAIEDHNAAPSYLVMGPWWHGGWAGSAGDRYGDLWFDQPTAERYRAEIEAPFFEHYLKGEPDDLALPEASVFVTGSNEWRAFDAWPPPEAGERPLYLLPGGGLGWTAPTASGAFAEYVSDPAKPVPHTPQIVVTRDDRYVVQDQRFASTRPDVLVFESPVLEEDLTLAGDLFATLFVTTTGTDADFVVKLIDVYPGDARCELPEGERCSVPMGGFQQLVRGEVMRGKFRESFSDPAPFVPGEVAEVTFDMEDVAHTFQAGHRMMVHVQSTWFPMVDRNPQRFMRIPEAGPDDYQAATHRVYLSAEHPSHLSVRVLE